MRQKIDRAKIVPLMRSIFRNALLSDVEEATDEGIVRMIEAGETREIKDPKNYAVRAARTAMIDKFRRENDDVNIDDVPEEDLSYDPYPALDMALDVEKVLNKYFSVAECEIIVEYFAEGLSVREIERLHPGKSHMTYFRWLEGKIRPFLCWALEDYRENFKVKPQEGVAA